jgi:hypothetical protein
MQQQEFDFDKREVELEMELRHYKEKLRIAEVLLRKYQDYEGRLQEFDAIEIENLKLKHELEKARETIVELQEKLETAENLL